ncbi:Stk1 family PASTA domain-containing Ser/Thr kinase [Actinokineospora fastidiosa]|uniref:non-specific serine/threonine protein kinase n=1 Tax=Actinokineospora fastidiosa TaxID=1816 RepID=A0A918LFI7_9PSEU|nr:Stk1 family PASTA domain-containing Ser/Thr kinase [Actinokineospora fastidiosa]GGS40378.1 serine/threonine protein kinase [Actinokineospora fastidiosa]
MRETGLIGALLEQRYRVDAPLARGGMSAVYRGVDTRLDRPVAIKVMDQRFAADPSFVERFEREARSAARIHHPNVVAVHDQGLDGDHVYLVMELVDGGTLRDLLIERGALPPPLAVSILEPVLAALAAAHAADLVHRDVKPENVLIGANGVVKVADFGLVRALSSPGTTKSSVILGTVSYLSPEQVTTGTATPRGDVYSAAIVLYEMLTGAPPYVGDNPLSVAYRHANDDVPQAGALVRGLPPALDELVTRATRRDPAARPADGAAFLAELQQVRATSALPRMRIPVPTPSPLPPAPPVEVPVVQEPDPGPEAPAPEEPDEDRTVTTDPADAPTERAVAPVHDPEATVRVSTGALAAAGIGQATVMRPPQGFSAAGPQGTRAMLRSDLEKVIEAAQQPPPPTGPQPLPGPPPPPPPPRSATRRYVLMGIAGVLVLALLGTLTWWFSSGRYTVVPSLAGEEVSAAEAAVREAGLTPSVDRQRHNQVPQGVVISTDPGGGAELLRGDPVTLVVSAGRPVVPDVAPGADPAAAEAAIREHGLQPQRDDAVNIYDEQVPEGRVVRLNPPAGSSLDIGTRVVIILSRGPAPKQVPDLRGKTRDEAFAELTANGFQPVDGPAEFSPDVEGGRVIRTDPPAGTTIDAKGNKQVTVVVSDAVMVPDLSGLTVPEAQAKLAEQGLSIELQPFSNGNGRVITQSPGPGTRVQRGGKVQVFAF